MEKLTFYNTKYIQEESDMEAVYNAEYSGVIILL